MIVLLPDSCVLHVWEVLFSPVPANDRVAAVEAVALALLLAHHPSATQAVVHQAVSLSLAVAKVTPGNEQVGTKLHYLVLRFLRHFYIKRIFYF
jgi:hypothetical protein